jgi:hypothetical protein
LQKEVRAFVKKNCNGKAPLDRLSLNASPVEDSPWRASDFHFGVSGSRGYTSQPLKRPMWRNGRRNGLKIAALAISGLIKID